MLTLIMAPRKPPVSRSNALIPVQLLLPLLLVVVVATGTREGWVSGLTGWVNEDSIAPRQLCGVLGMQRQACECDVQWIKDNAACNRNPRSR